MSACALRIFVTTDIPLYCPPTALGNQDYHEHTSGGSIQTGYFKKATLLRATTGDRA